MKPAPSLLDESLGLAHVVDGPTKLKDRDGEHLMSQLRPTYRTFFFPCL